jgi:Zn-dependent protease
MEPQFEVIPPPRPAPQPPKSNPKGIFGWIAGLGLMLYKFSAFFLIIFKTGGTMLISIGAYSLIFGWKFAAGLVFLIFVHELGHVVAAKAYRIPVTAPMFIPFVGAYVMLRRPMSSYANAIISYAGPLAGGLGGWACYYLGLVVGGHWIMAVALYTFILNLFNLLPIPPHDGSHIWRCFFPRSTPDVPASDRAYLGIFMAALLAGLALGIMQTWGNLPPPSDLAPSSRPSATWAPNRDQP